MLPIAIRDIIQLFKKVIKIFSENSIFKSKLKFTIISSTVQHDAFIVECDIIHTPVVQITLELLLQASLCRLLGLGVGHECEIKIEVSSTLLIYFNRNTELNSACGITYFADCNIDLPFAISINSKLLM